MVMFGTVNVTLTAKLIINITIMVILKVMIIVTSYGDGNGNSQGCCHDDSQS